MTEGIREEIKIVASESAHYTRFNVAGWLGLGTKNLVTIPTTRDNEISLGHFERYLKRAFAERGKGGGDPGDHGYHRCLRNR